MNCLWQDYTLKHHMNTISTAIIQPNLTVGAIAENRDKIAELISAAVGQGAQLAILPELAVSGYPPEDLILKFHFLEECEAALRQIATAIPPQACAIVGAPELSGDKAYNTAAVLTQGEVAARYRKNVLPNYGVFDEKRVFEEGDVPALISINDAIIALHICEDSWQAGANEMDIVRAAGASAIVNISASPFHRRRVKDRAEMAARCARMGDAHFVYANLVGGQDELVFDGASMVVDPDGTVLARAAHFAEDILHFELPTKTGKHEGLACRIELPENAASPPEHSVAGIETDESEVYAALKLGLRDYCAKNGFEDVVIAISGGIDSALAATIAVDALGAGHVTGITMPSQYTSEGTLSDAGHLARNLGIELHNIPIRPLYDKFMEDLLPLWPGRGADVTEENLQARIRGTIVMAVSNKFGQLVISTGNKSEIAVGYCTLYGDMVGGFSLLKDVPKTMVFSLARWRNARGGQAVIPASTIERPPSAELRADQLDSDSLPPYEVLDPILDRYIELDQHIDDIIAAGFDAESVARVVRLVDLNEYKRRQGAPGVKITPKAFGRDRRMPITNRYQPQLSL